MLFPVKFRPVVFEQHVDQVLKSRTRNTRSYIKIASYPCPNTQSACGSGSLFITMLPMKTCTTLRYKITILQYGKEWVLYKIKVSSEELAQGQLSASHFEQSINVIREEEYVNLGGVVLYSHLDLLLLAFKINPYISGSKSIRRKGRWSAER